MLYHVSPEAGLKTIRPHTSSHNKAYVYALRNLVAGLLFGVKHDDFDFIISTDENDIPIICECYPGALEKTFKGKSCSVYIVDESGFQDGLTSWEPELVCEREVEVITETIIEDVYQRLLEEEQKHMLKVSRYEFNDEYRGKIASHIVDRLIRFDVDLDSCTKRDIRFATYYRGIVQALIDIMNGHLLQ